ncbi:hypothetical protein DENSPDRAFT_838672 [Dentipellis sp. KUC8613]|nr:hypothetical protein DENSPDRAFT_838672 [Dentipellis sp. KUC8613]
MNEPSDVQSVESRNAQLEDELRDTHRKVELLQAQLNFVKEGAQQEVARLELDLSDARKARNHFRQLSSVKTAEAEEDKRLAHEAKRDAEEARTQATKWKQEAYLLRAELQTLRQGSSGSTRSFPSTSVSRSPRDHGLLKEEPKGPSHAQPNKEQHPCPPLGQVDIIVLSDDDDDIVNSHLHLTPMEVNSQLSDAVARAGPSNGSKTDQLPKAETKDAVVSMPDLSTIPDNHSYASCSYRQLKTDSSPKAKPLIKANPETQLEPVLKRMATEHAELPFKDSATPSKRQKLFDEFQHRNAPAEAGGSENPQVNAHTPVPADSPGRVHISEDIMSPSNAPVDHPPSPSRPSAAGASPSPLHSPPPRRWMRTRLPPKISMADYTPVSQSKQPDSDFEVLSSVSELDDDEEPQPRRKRKGKEKAKQRPSEQASSGDEAAVASSSQRAPRKTINVTNHIVSTSLKERVANFTPFAVNPPASPTLAVSRTFLTKVYGVSGMTMLVKIAPEKNVPRGEQRPMIFPRSDNNPNLPTSPGEPGTMLCNRSDVLACGPVALWVKAMGAKENVWRYMGDYELKKSVSPLTAAEARQFPTETVKAWAKTLGARKHDAYAEIRVRIWLRKNDEAITDNAVRRQMGLLKDKNSKIELSQSEIYNALCAGEEMLHVLTLRCVGYDHKFMADVEENWHRFVPKAKGSRM